ncbi:hypothetical protein, partial [Castellaniella defragrans]
LPAPAPEPPDRRLRVLAAMLCLVCGGALWQAAQGRRARRTAAGPADLSSPRSIHPAEGMP